MKPNNLLNTLRARGVNVPAPETVWLGADLVPERFAAGATIHPGCRLQGAQTALGPEASVGAEGPATLINCQFGAGVGFASGFARQATLLDGVALGSGAHLRPGTLLEEQATGGHCVGLKQTILLPFVTLGSLINFCDCLMAGGTGADNHSEVGSGYVHFNFTPHQDKATPSLIGDVPRGVLVNQSPIFLGGQGGLVGPRRIAYGTVLAAGVICRRDIDPPGQLVIEPATSQRIERPYQPGRFGDIAGILANNLAYLGNLVALECWYRQVRAVAFGSGPVWRQALCDGALCRLDEAFTERLKRLDQLAGKVADALDPAPDAANPSRRQTQAAFARGWAAQRERIAAWRATRTQAAWPETLPRPQPGEDMVAWVRALDAEQQQDITRHLQHIVAEVPKNENETETRAG